MPSLAILGVATLLAVTLAVAAGSGPVDRSRVERFTERQRLTITPSNGTAVIRYLATTRRWRAAGMAGGFLISLAWTLPDRLGVDFLGLFAGWFVGALVAEARIARMPFGPNRAASLVPRVPADYLPRAAWALPPVAAAVSVAVAAVTAVLARWHPAVGTWPGVLWGAAAVGLAVAVRAIQRHVLRRPQPVGPPDVVAADDAIRSRSLHVLAGGGTTLVLYCIMGQVATLVAGRQPPGTGDVGVGLLVYAAFSGYIAVPVLGWAVATSPWSVTRRAEPATHR
jgi:hypothetical protein